MTILKKFSRELLQTITELHEALKDTPNTSTSDDKAQHEIDNKNERSPVMNAHNGDGQHRL